MLTANFTPAQTRSPEGWSNAHSVATLHSPAAKDRLIRGPKVVDRETTLVVDSQLTRFDDIEAAIAEASRRATQEPETNPMVGAFQAADGAGYVARVIANTVQTDPPYGNILRVQVAEPPLTKVTSVTDAVSGLVALADATGTMRI